MSINTIQCGPRVSVTTIISGGDAAGAYRPVIHPYDYWPDGYTGFNDTSVPLSTYYGSLGAAQAAFPLTHAYLTARGLTAMALTDLMDWATIQEAILAVPVNGGECHLPPGIARVNRTLYYGNATTTTRSTYNGLILSGSGDGHFTAGSGTAATSIKAVASMAALLQYDGPLTDVVLRDLHLDGNDLANKVLNLIHVFESYFTRIHVARPLTHGIWLGHRTGQASGVGVNASSNRFDFIVIKPMNPSNVIGFQLGNEAADGAIRGCSRNYINQLEITPATGNTTCIPIMIRYADACWFNCVSILFASIPIYYRACSGVTGELYPQNVCFNGTWLSGVPSFDNTAAWGEFGNAYWDPTSGPQFFGLYGREGDGQETDGPPLPTSLLPNGKPFACGFDNRGLTWNLRSYNGGLRRVRLAYALTGPQTVPAPDTMVDEYLVEFTQDATGGWVVTWNALWPSDVSSINPTFAVDQYPNSASRFYFVRVGTAWYLVGVPIIQRY